MIKKIDLLNKGKSYIKHIKLKNFKNKKNYHFSSKFSDVKNSDIIIICLPTPLKKNFTPEMKYLRQSAKFLRNNIKKVRHLY